MKPAKVLFFLFAFTMSAVVWAHDKAPQGKTEKKPISAEEKDFGREGDPKKASRTIRIDMSDTMRFTPADLTIKQGETIRFDVRNSGRTMHEMVLGTMKELKEHCRSHEKASRHGAR